MLTLSRKIGESIRYEVPPSNFPTVILVGVSEILGNRTKIYTDCPRDVLIERSEIYAANLAAKTKEVK